MYSNYTYTGLSLSSILMITFWFFLPFVYFILFSSLLSCLSSMIPIIFSIESIFSWAAYNLVLISNNIFLKIYFLILVNSVFMLFVCSELLNFWFKSFSVFIELVSTYLEILYNFSHLWFCFLLMEESEFTLAVLLWLFWFLKVWILSAIFYWFRTFFSHRPALTVLYKQK